MQRKGRVRYLHFFSSETNDNVFQLSHFKIPKYIEFVDTFPTTVTGKIQKFVMRDDLARRLKDSSQRSSVASA